MFAHFLAQRLAAMIVALGVFLGGTAPAWADAAMPAGGSSGMSMMMPGMDMPANCMDSQGKRALGDQAPCKGTDSSCAVCAGCAINVGLAPNFSPVTLVYHRSAGLFVADARPDGLTTPPALPPPILRS